jgi:quinol monooxygenase YgiN
MARLSFGNSGSVRRPTVKRFTGTACVRTRPRYRRVDEMCSLKRANHQRDVAGLGSPAYSMQEKPMTKFALYVPLQAKPGKEKEVADFLRSAVPLVNAEAGTVSWFAIQEGPSSFAIFDTFDDEAGRDAHLNGKVAAALMEKAKAGDLFAKAPEIYTLEILADKLPG